MTDTELTLMAALTLMKGLPMAYDRDMQESAFPLFRTTDIVEPSLRVLAELVRWAGGWL